MTVFNPFNQQERPIYEPYQNRWIAIVAGQVIGVGVDAEQAYRAAKKARPKARPQIFFVDGQSRLHGQPIDTKQWFQDDLLKRIVHLFQERQAEVYLVGGAVRDGLLGCLNAKADIDLVIPTDALNVARMLADRLHAAYYPIDPERGVGRVVMPERRSIDLAAYRGNTLDEDLALRDFTINAMVLRLDQKTPILLDPLNGQVDLAQQKIKAVGPRSISDDPLRAVRAVRLAAQLDFEIEPDTENLIRSGAPGLKQVSPERMRDELFKLMQVTQPGRAVARLYELGLLAYILPEALAMVGVEQSPPHTRSVFEHTLAVMDQCELLDLDDHKIAFLAPFKNLLLAYLDAELAGGVRRRTLISLIALLHDIGKPATFQRGSDDRIRFWNHAKVGAEMTQAILTRWRVSSQVMGFVTTAVEQHLRPLLLASQNSAGKRAIHRFLVATEETAPAVALLALVDHLGTYSHYQDNAAWQALTDVVFKICQAYFTPKPSPLLTGTEVMAYLQIPAGPIIGQALAALREAQAADEVATVDEAKAFIIQMGQERGWLAADQAKC